MSQAVPPILSLRNLSKTFGGTTVLSGVDLDLAAGEVHGLLGANGSGKSTLVKILAGVHAPDAGAALTLNGHKVPLPLRPGDYRRHGLSFMHQNLGLVPTLSVLENLRAGHLLQGGRLYIDWAGERAAAREALERFGLDIDPDQRVADLSPVERALLAIVRAFEDLGEARRTLGAPGLVVLDEPTPFLPREGVERMFALVRRLTAQGAGVLFISHDIDEVMEITDRITVLRDGRVSGQAVTANCDHQTVIDMIVGRRIARAGVAVRSETASRGDRLAVGEAITGGALRDVRVELYKGEILGLTGLIGSGYADLPYLLFGARPAQGRLILDGLDIDLAGQSPRRALDLGIGLAPGDRAAAGVVGALSITDNIFLPSLDRFVRAAMLDRGAMTRRAGALAARFQLRPNRPGLALASLSGGNAQKVLLAKWLQTSPLLLMLDEPTQGVDVGARDQIFALLKAAAAEGMSILCASSDQEQLAEICDRVLAFRHGRISQVLTGAALTKDGLAAACYGAPSKTPAESLA